MSTTFDANTTQPTVGSGTQAQGSTQGATPNPSTNPHPQGQRPRSSSDPEVEDTIPGGLSFDSDKIRDMTHSQMIQYYSAKTPRDHGFETLTDAHLALLNQLDVINGQDAYSVEAVSLGKVSINEYLVLPTGFVYPATNPEDVGDATTAARFTKRTLAEIYVLNKLAAPTGTDAIAYGLVRMEAVKMGWLDNQKEVRFAPAVTNSMATFLADLSVRIDKLADYRRLAFIHPMIAEHTFRTMGHHYLSGIAGEYQRRYEASYASCLCTDLLRLFSAEVQYHSLLHWISPGRASAVARACVAAGRTPEAISIRLQAPPAGTALITTGFAVLQAMDANDYLKELLRSYDLNMGVVTILVGKIKADPGSYHKFPQAYGLGPLSDDDADELAHVKAKLAGLAPVLQGFLDAMYKNAALGRAKALLKAAEENPMQRKKAQKFFKSEIKADISTLRELIPGSKPVGPAQRGVPTSTASSSST